MVPRIGELALTAMQTHVIFNNNMEDQGQRNARSLTEHADPRRRAMRRSPTRARRLGRHGRGGCS